MKYKFKVLEEKKPLSYYVDAQHPLYEDLLSLIRTECKSDLYEARANTEYVIDDLTGKLIKTGRVNLVGYPIKNDNDVVEIARIVGNKKFETSRILYVKDGVITGQDAVTVDMPGLSPFHAEENDALGAEKIRQKFDRLKANGYYVLHNHPSGDSTPSEADKKLCQAMASQVYGFLCGIVIGDDNFSIIKVDKQTFKPYIEFKGKLDDDRIILKDMDAIFQLAQKHMSDENSSYIIYIDSGARLISVQRILNKEFNDKNIFLYISNEKHNNGARNCYLCTFSEDIYWKACNYTGTDRLFFDTFLIEDNLYMSARAEGDNLGMIVKDREMKPTKL